jgi:hypothetical protein
LIEESLAETLAFLLGHGHKLCDIWTYTIRQLNALVGLAIEEDKRQQLAMVWGQRIAYHADGKAYSQAIKTLEK